MKVDRERELNGVVIISEDDKDAELLKYLWCNRAGMAEFNNLGGEIRLTIAAVEEDKDGRS